MKHIEIEAGIDFRKYRERIENTKPIRVYGRVSQIVGLVVEGIGPASSIGDMCEIHTTEEKNLLRAEVVGFKAGKVLLMPLEGIRGIGPSCRIVSLGKKADVRVGKSLFGRVIDGMGNPIDGRGSMNLQTQYHIYANPINPLSRKRITEVMDLGIRSINALLTCGKGQKIGIFSGSGVGKSVLLGMIAKNSRADVNVIGLIGERGREVREFLEKNLGQEGLGRSVVIVATSDTHPIIRMRAAYVATTIAEYFRDQGLSVLLMVDSLTRFAMAQREVGLSIGEPPTTKGYTPSVFSTMPKLLERVGAVEGKGSITGIYTILVEGGDFDEPIADAARSILDGHVNLSRLLASRNHYPAIDVLNSISRVMVDVVDEEHRIKANKILSLISAYRKSEDLINIGAYVSGSNQEIDYAIKMMDRIDAFLKQSMNDKISFEESRSELFALFD